MISRIAQISIILITLVVSGCFEPPEFPDNPIIGFKSLRYITNLENGDSLLLTFDIEDGDGDIGLGDQEFNYPYHAYDLIIDSRDTLVRYSNDIVPPLYTVDPSGRVELFSETDSRINFDCSAYVTTEKDTFFISPNEYRFNLFIDFQRKVQGQYSPIDFEEELGVENCGVGFFDARIPIFDKENIGRSLSGEISYSLSPVSQFAGYEIIFRRDTFKMVFYIYDRALHKSNVVESPDLTFPGITED
ncbi:MAG: hypothetical protein RIC35_10880 [Marinoscillum sp.]